MENPAFLGNTFDAVIAEPTYTVRNGQQIQNLKMMNDSVVTASLRQNPKQTLPLFTHGTTEAL
ncbi:hypothetical protein ACVPOQ_02625 [Staphylococcus aureus]